MTTTLPSRPRHHRPDTHRLAEGEQVVVVGFGPVAGRFLDEMLPEVEAGRVGLTVVGAETEAQVRRQPFRVPCQGRLGDDPYGRSGCARILSGETGTCTQRTRQPHRE